MASVTHTGVAAVAPTSNTVRAMMPTAKTIFRSTLLLVRQLDLTIELLDEIDDGARRMGMTGEELRLRLDAAGQLVEFGIGAVHAAIGGAVGRAVSFIVLPECAVEFVVAVGVVVQDDAAGRRIDDNLFDAGDDTENFADLL